MMPWQRTGQTGPAPRDERTNAARARLAIEPAPPLSLAEAAAERTRRESDRVGTALGASVTIRGKWIGRFGPPMSVAVAEEHLEAVAIVAVPGAPIQYVAPPEIVITDVRVHWKEGDDPPPFRLEPVMFHGYYGYSGRFAEAVAAAEVLERKISNIEDRDPLEPMHHLGIAIGDMCRVLDKYRDGSLGLVDARMMFADKLERYVDSQARERIAVAVACKDAEIAKLRGEVAEMKARPMLGLCDLRAVSEALEGAGLTLAIDPPTGRALILNAALDKECRPNEGSGCGVAFHTYARGVPPP